MRWPCSRWASGRRFTTCAFRRGEQQLGTSLSFELEAQVPSDLDGADVRLERVDR